VPVVFRGTSDFRHVAQTRSREISRRRISCVVSVRLYRKRQALTAIHKQGGDIFQAARNAIEAVLAFAAPVHNTTYRN
jgi:hypothetical protein